MPALSETATHHQGEGTDVVVAILVEVPVVAVQTIILEVAEVEAIAALEELPSFITASHPWHHPLKPAGDLGVEFYLGEYRTPPACDTGWSAFLKLQRALAQTVAGAILA